MSKKIKKTKLNKIDHFYTFESNNKTFDVKIDDFGELHIYSNGQCLKLIPFSIEHIRIRQDHFE